jgi:hypothetical protein
MTRRGGLRGAGGIATESSIAANRERGFCPKKGFVANGIKLSYNAPFINWLRASQGDRTVMNWIGSVLDDAEPDMEPPGSRRLRATRIYPKHL